MIVHENRNDDGCEDASQAFCDFVSSAPDATTIDRVSYLLGMQAFCRNQLKHELTAAMDALDTGVDRPFETETSTAVMAGGPA